MNIQENVDIKKYSTFNIGGQFRYFSLLSSVSDVESLCTIIKRDRKYKDFPIFILGGGSNIIFSDGIIDVFALKMEIKGVEVINETDEHIDIKVGAGEIWDEIVEKTVKMNLCGLEAMSLIPGTVGATPIQNVGAYGVEAKDVILEVEVFDVKEGNILTISNENCKFGYRDSIFKNEAKGKYIITGVTYRLKRIKKQEKTSPETHLERSSDEGGRGARPSQDGFRVSFSKTLEYPSVKKYFEDNEIQNPNLKQVRSAIIDIRNEKLPNYKEIPNVGSFFKNSIISNNIAEKVKDEYPDVRLFPVDDNFVKIPSGWLIEKAGLKGKSFGKISVYDKNALILVNNGGARKEDIINVRNEIIKIVEEKFGITLEQEPEIL